MKHLILKWRAESAMATVAGLPYSADALRRCAEELEQAWHDRAHGGDWEIGCLVCKKERDAAKGEP